MEVAGGILLAAFLVGTYMRGIAARTPSRVALAKPVTVWFLPTVVGALAAGLLAAFVVSRLGLGGWAVIAFLGVGWLVLRTGAVETPARLAIDRGNINWPTGEVVGAVVLFGILVWAFAFS